MKKKDVVNAALLAAAILFVTGSLCLAWTHSNGLLFSRSGSIMVLLGVVVDYRIGAIQQRKNASATAIAGMTGAPVSGNLSKREAMTLRLAHVLAVVGTLIWGYGDLVIA